MKLEENHKFTQDYYKEEYEKLGIYREEILSEKLEWESERDLIRKKMYGTFLNSTLSLDVGGTHQIKTNQDLLCSVTGSLLQKMFSGAHDIPVNQDGNVFLDRDGATFLCLINYLRNERSSFPAFDSKEDEHLFMKELEFWDMIEDIQKFRAVVGKTKMPKKREKTPKRKSSSSDRDSSG